MTRVVVVPEASKPVAGFLRHQHHLCFDDCTQSMLFFGYPFIFKEQEHQEVIKAAAI